MKVKLATLIAAALICAPAASAGFHAPPAGYWANCGAAVWGWHGATHYTSCPFARNVASGVRSSSEYGAYRLIGTAYSPVTHKTYRVNCVRQTYRYRCTAGISAIVWISF